MFSEARFPEDISYGSAGGPVYSTDIVTSAAGYEKRNSNWSQARAVYNVAHGVKNKAQLDTLIAFFRARRGRAEAFRFKDWTDYQIINGVIGEGDGVQTTFQITKRYHSTDAATTRTILKPVDGSVNMYVDGVLEAAVTIDVNTGIITFTTPPAQGSIISVDCEFDVPVRFETDQLIARLDEYGLYSWGDIALVEVRL